MTHSNFEDRFQYVYAVNIQQPGQIYYYNVNNCSYVEFYKRFHVKLTIHELSHVTIY